MRGFNPSTGLMLISTPLLSVSLLPQLLFQSLDWVDVDFDGRGCALWGNQAICFNPSTGLMLISTSPLPIWISGNGCFNPSTGLMLISTSQLLRHRSYYHRFQSLDWVDVDFDIGGPDVPIFGSVVSIPRLG